MLRCRRRRGPRTGFEADGEAEAEGEGEGEGASAGDARVVRVRVRADAVRARAVASLLNLPFRADRGTCDTDVEVLFPLGQEEAGGEKEEEEEVPQMFGSATLRGASMRFHPDPTTPEFSGIAGGLRFDDRTMFVDGPNGRLGSLPMTVIGSIDLRSEARRRLQPGRLRA